MMGVSSQNMKKKGYNIHLSPLIIKIILNQCNMHDGLHRRWKGFLADVYVNVIANNVLKKINTQHFFIRNVLKCSVGRLLLLASQDKLIGIKWKKKTTTIWLVSQQSVIHQWIISCSRHGEDTGGKGEITKDAWELTAD